jgi:hypothetical protein
LPDFFVQSFAVNDCRPHIGDNILPAPVLKKLTLGAQSRNLFPNWIVSIETKPFDRLREFRRQSEEGQEAPPFPILIPIALARGDEDLIIHSGKTYRERYLEGRLSSVLFGQ